MIRTGLLIIVRSQGYKYNEPKAHLDSRQQTGYTRNKWMNKWNWNCITCLVENIQNCAGCAEYCVEYARKSMTTDISIVITQGRLCFLDNLECKTEKTESRSSTLICLMKSFNISFILSPVSVPPRDMDSISRLFLKGQRK